MNELIINTLICVWVGILVIPFLLGFFSVIAEKVWLRGDTEVNMAYYFQRFLFKRLNDSFYRNSTDERDQWEGFVERVGKDSTVCASWCMYSMLFCGIFTGAAVFVLQNNILNESLILGGGVLGFLYIPRFIIDLCKTLKYKPKTGESETIEKLKEDVKNLQERLDSKQ